ncbi:MAG TPA: DUF2304 domain-containing protein [Solirubrobacteraceae bacterium]|jgi:hypothetical protein|nr:DUF2304 domain-containing protein [Solirubrobacteraceae bacterium]
MRIRLITILAAVAILILIIELVRRRKLKEEYSLLWVLTAALLVVLSIWYGLLVKVTHLIGGTVPSSTLFFFGLVFVVSLLLHFSVRISLLERRITALVQEIGLLTLESRSDGPDVADTQRGGPSDASTN